MDIMEIMKFSSEAKITRTNWWISVVALMVLNVVLTIVGVIPAALVSIMILVPSIAFAVSRLRDRGHSGVPAFALRLIIFPWGIIECGFLAGTE